MSAVTYDGEPEGLAAMLGGLIEANLERDPSRRGLLRPATVTIRAPDADVLVALRIMPGSVHVSAQSPARVDLAIAADSSLLLALSAAPLRFGLPDPLATDGRRIVGALLRGDLQIRGMLAHLGKLARLNRLLSVN